MSTRKFKLGLIGYGFSAKIFQLPFIDVVPELSVHGIVQRNPTPENNVEKDRPGCRRYSSVDELFKDSEVDLVVVTTAPDTHYELVKGALEAGKHVLCEKPFVPTYKEASELVQLAKQKNLFLTVYQNRRWDSDFQTVSKIIRSGQLGRVVDFETHFDRHRPAPPNPASWKSVNMPGGSSIYDLGAHLLDQVVQLFGVPEKVTGFIGSQRETNPTGYEDSFTVLCHYKGGLVATARASVISPEEKQLRYWVRGEKASFKKYHLDCQEAQLISGKRPGDNGFGVESRDSYGTLTTVGADNALKSDIYPTVEPPTYAELYRKLARALAGDGENPVPAEQAADVLRVIEAAQISSKEGKTIQL